MKILYGVVGEGMGHAMRSRVILEHLVHTHDVEIMASGRATDFLRKRFAGVNGIHGLHMIYEENRVRLGHTLWSNILAGATGVPNNIVAYFQLVDRFKPDVVISDFESWTYLYGKTKQLPVLSIDNMQIINRTTLPDDVIEGHRAELAVTKAFIKSKLPFCDEYFITTFFRPPIRKERTRLFAPILRPEGNDGLAKTLAATGLECRIYGMRRDLKEEAVEGKLRYRPFSEAGFIDDLASSRAVIAGGGFTLMGEAVYLKKPMLAVPLARQFEQVLNARYLEREGYGMWAASLDDPRVVSRFLERVPECARVLAGYHQDDNHEILAAVDEFLARAATEPR
jgi:Glycosyl transferase family 1